METVATKACTKCRIEKPLSAFWKQKDRRDGRAGVCKSCKLVWIEAREAKAATARANTPPGTKKECPLCGSNKPVEEFPFGVSKHGRHTWCTPCGNIRRRSKANATPDSIARTKASKRKCATGFTHDDFVAANNVQGNCCAICHACFSDTKPQADHNHLSGEKRGLLCGSCNRALGLMNDSAELLRRAAEYLENPPLRGVL